MLIQLNQYKYIFLLIKLMIHNFLILKCNCQNYFIPSQNNFEFCSEGFRVSIFSVDEYNGTSGCSIYFLDQAEISYYRIDISYFNHNWLPKYSTNNLFKISKSNVPKNIKNYLQVKKEDDLNDYQIFSVYFREYFFFVSDSDIGRTQLAAYSNELVSCPQMMCLNAYLDASFYHEDEKKYYFFRGPYYYTLDHNFKKFKPEFNLIQTKFFNVPMYIDSAVYLKSDFYPSGYVILFSKEDLIYIYSPFRGIAVEISQSEVFPQLNINFKAVFIDTMTDLGNNQLMILKKNSFSLFEIDYESKYDISNYEIRFKNLSNSFTIQTNENHIEKADDSITLKDKNKIMFFKKWKVFSYDLDEFRIKIRTSILNEKQVTINLVNETIGILFYDYFKCENNYSKLLNLKENEFKDIYLHSLPNYHDKTIWYKLITSITPYDPTLIYIAIGIISSFLLVSYMLLFIFLMIYFTSSKKVDKLTIETKTSSERMQSKNYSRLPTKLDDRMLKRKTIIKLEELPSEYQDSKFDKRDLIKSNIFKSDLIKSDLKPIKTESSQIEQISNRPKSTKINSKSVKLSGTFKADEFSNIDTFSDYNPISKVSSKPKGSSVSKRSLSRKYFNN